jgi:hypothetical protein
MCCGNTIAQTYGQQGDDSTQNGWVVTYPNGVKESKTSETSARLAAALVPGAKYAKASTSDS